MTILKSQREKVSAATVRSFYATCFISKGKMLSSSVMLSGLQKLQSKGPAKSLPKLERAFRRLVTRMIFWPLWDKNRSL